MRILQSSETKFKLIILLNSGETNFVIYMKKIHKTNSKNS